MKVGDAASVTRVFSLADVDAYIAISGARSRAPDALPPPLVGALFSYLLGVALPGRGTNYLKQQTRYANDARIGETLTARVTITRLRPDKHLVDLETTCVGEDGRAICSGRALVYIGDIAPAER